MIFVAFPPNTSKNFETMNYFYEMLPKTMI